MLTFLLICILVCTLLGLACAVYSYLALKGSAEHADLAAASDHSAHKALAAALSHESGARVAEAKAERHASEAGGYAAEALAHSDEAANHADDAALALGKMKPEAITIVNHYPEANVGVLDGELFSHPSFERDCE